MSLEKVYLIRDISFIVMIFSGMLFLVGCLYETKHGKFDYFIEEYDEKTNKRIKRTKITEEEYYKSPLPEYKKRSLKRS